MFIYGLYDNSGELRYVGQTIQSLEDRLYHHLMPSQLRKDIYKNRWIKSLTVSPTIQLIQELYTKEDLNNAEKYWIKFFKEQGCRLVNTGEGGIGGSAKGKILSQKAINNIVNSNKTRIITQELRTKYSVNAKKQFANSEARIRLSRKQGGKSFTDQFGNRYETVNEASRTLNIHRSQIQRVLKGVDMKQTHGYVFNYTE